MSPFAMRLLLLCFSLFMFSCQSAPKAAQVPGTPGQPKAVVPTAAPIAITPSAKGTSALLARAVTSLGENRSPKFSPDGSKILFISSTRPSHRQAQVYELDLTRMTERRVTFHDGDDQGAGYAMGGQKIVYSSDTDEIKEDVSLERLKNVYEASKSTSAPNGIRALPRKVAGDIYLQRLDGRDIERLTSLSSRESSPAADISSKTPRLAYSSNQGGEQRLYLFNGKSSRAISHGGDDEPAFSPDGKYLVWTRTNAANDKSKTPSTQLMMSDDLKSATPLTSPGFRDLSPAWTSKGESVLFSSNRGGKESASDIYMIDRKASCLKRLTEVQMEISSPVMSPDGSKIAFAARVKDQSQGFTQIYVMDDRSASIACEPVR